MRLFFTFLLFFCFFHSAQAQISKDATVPLSANFTASPATITLNWPNPGNANLTIKRRKKGQGGLAWQQVLNVTASDLTTFTDNAVQSGQIFEYQIQRTLNGLNAYGYVHVAINAPLVNYRGKVLIFVDSTTADALGLELVRLKNDMRGDGWWPIPFHTGPSSTVQSVKDQIVASYNADPTNVKAVLLLGSVPIPYSGDVARDGHPDHAGAWPADTYYAEVNGTWTDNSINDSSPSRAANVNIPGDGKFDQSVLPSPAELQVGRVDFRHINAAAFGVADQIGLMKRYLDKDHNWRTGAYTVENKALIDDNFGYFSGEAFAANGFRNAYPLVGEANIVEADFFVDSNPQSYLLGYGCGSGYYNSVAGVGASTDFATDSVNIVFSNLFGSYLGDWDYEFDPIMPSALASRGGILTCSWAGRPHWFNQALASGETIGYCTKETMNAQFNNGFNVTYGATGAHVALLGDPTLRANVVKPATNLVLTSPNCQSVELSWTASADSIEGYHIYRALSQDGPYVQLTTNLINSTTYSDQGPIQDTLFYQVRAVKSVTTPGGGTYVNNATGPIKSIVYRPAPTVNASASGNTLNCNNQPVQLYSGNGNPAAIFSWTGPGNFISNEPNPLVSLPGTYVLVVNIGGCTSTDSVEIVPAVIVNLVYTTTDETAPNANNGTIDLSAAGGTGPLSYLWSNGATTEDLSALAGGVYQVTVTDIETGCSSVISVMVNTTSATEEAALFEQFQLSPNPTRGLASLSLKLHQAATLRVEIRDAGGRLIWANPVQKTAALQLPIDLTQHPTGNYTLSVWVENQVFVRKLTVIR